MRSCIFFVLIPAFLVASQGIWADSFDPGDNTPNGATFLVSPTGSEQIHGPHDLNSSDPADWFEILLVAGNTYTFFTTGNTVTVGRIFDPDGQVIAGNEVINPFNIEAGSLYESFTPQVTGIFQIEITALDPNALTTYTLHYINRTAPDAPTDRFDPGDDTAFAPFALTDPTVEQQSTLPRFLSTTDTQDWFGIQLQADIVYEFFSTGNDPLSGELFSDTGNTRIVEGFSEDNGLNFRLLFQPESGGLFFLRVQSDPQGWNASYTLHFQISEQTFETGDAWDPEDDIIEGASLLIPAPFEQSHGAHTLTPNDRYDWFCAVLTEGVVYRFFSTLGSNTSADLIGTDGETVLIPSGNVIGESYFDIEFAPVLSGTYYLRVQKANADFSAYNLMFLSTQLLPQTEPDEWDPRDNEFSGATNLGLPALEPQTLGLHTLSNEDRGDWFRVTLARGQRYSFSSTGGDDTFLHLFDSDGATQLMSDDDSGIGLNASLSFEAPFDGTFFLLVRMADSGANGEYHLVFQQTETPSPSGDRWDPIDNSREGATEFSLTAAGITHGPHHIGGIDPEDWFGFVLLRGWTYVFSTAGNADVLGALFRGGEIDPLRIDDDGGEGLNFRLQIQIGQTAEFWLRVRERLNRSGEYTLQIQGQPPIENPENPGTVDITPDVVFRLDSTVEFTHIPGGFGGASSGTVSVQPIPIDENGLSDGRGVEITVRAGQVSLLQFPEVFAGEFTVLMRASVRTGGAAVSPALAVADGTLDGSIATSIPAQSGSFVDQYQRMVLLYDPPHDGGVIPIFQAAGLGEETTVHLDNLEIYLIPPEGDFPAVLLNGGDL